uniref:FMRFamide-16 n=1 Tax=Sarcophaga bullata TaxID=7385 RepID=FAR16_SARBU|nr:RecName: Full=FMRFamide-16; AltName: Full=SabFMRFamide-16 [Sarcophaga bullata]
AAAGDNFMRF